MSEEQVAASLEKTNCNDPFYGYPEPEKPVPHESCKCLPKELMTEWMELNSLTDLTLSFAWSGNINSDEYEHKIKEIVNLRRKFLALMLELK